MTTYASHRREIDRKNRRIRRTEWAAWTTHAQATGATGKVKIDPEDGSLWEWISTTRQLTWVRPARKIEWAHQTGSKTMLSHAYQIGCDGKAMPLCGTGTIWRCTTLSSTSKGRKYPLMRCAACAKIVGA